MTLDPPILWRFAGLDEFRSRCPGGGQQRLSAKERGELARLRDANRRDGWLLGRVLIKELLREHVLDGDAAPIEITSRDDMGRGVRPKVTIAGRTAPWSLSISHTKKAALVAMCPIPGISIGVDLAPGEPAAPGFARSWFDGSERALLARGDWLEAARLWAVKEAVYKAVNQNDPFAPRRVRVRRAPCGGYQCTYRGVDLAGCCCIQTWVCGDHVAALATVHSEAGLGDAIAPLCDASVCQTARGAEDPCRCEETR
jgi:phosphopantetheinyl transferase